MTESRRAFLRHTAALAAIARGPAGARMSVPLASGLAALGGLAARQAHSADAGGYKAVVCLFLQGGNDSHNWVVPTDAANQAAYAAARGELAWDPARLLPLSSSSQGSGRSFGVPQELAPLRDWYEAGQAAVVANVGTLLRPITKADFRAGLGLPSKLFSHNDQQSMWQSLQPEGAPDGWGGRMGDLLMSANGQPVFTAVSATGNAVFLVGRQVTPYQVGPDGPVLVRGTQPGWRAGSEATPVVLKRLLAARGDDDFQAEYLKVAQRALSTAGSLQSAMAGSGVAALPATPIALPGGGSLALQTEPLARQLRVVAQMIAAAPGMGMRRQVFMVGLSGFDSHANQMRDQPLLMSRVAHSVGWFLEAMRSAGLLQNVVLFTASDFGRTLVSNGDGSDHGWGSHHWVFGGAVKGREIHGRFPVTATGTAEDLGSGRLLPTTSVTELAATLGRWMGLSSTELGAVLPNLGQFSGHPMAWL